MYSTMIESPANVCHINLNLFNTIEAVVAVVATSRRSNHKKVCWIWIRHTFHLCKCIPIVQMQIDKVTSVRSFFFYFYVQRTFCFLFVWNELKIQVTILWAATKKEQKNSINFFVDQENFAHAWGGKNILCSSVNKVYLENTKELIISCSFLMDENWKFIHQV